MSQLSCLPSINRVAQVSLDSVVAILAILLAFTVRFEGHIPPEYQSLAEVIILLGMPSRLALQGCFGIYRQIWRLFSQRDFWAILQAVSFYSLLLVFVTRLLLPRFMTVTNLPLGVAVMDWGFCLLGMTVIRFLRAWTTCQYQVYMKKSPNTRRRVILVGAGRAGAQIVQETRQNPNLNLQVIGFLDDDVTKLHRRVEGIKILGKTAQVVPWAVRLKADEALITMPSAPSDRIQQIVNLAKAEGLKIRILPRVDELLLDRSLTGQVREIRLEDLLGRPEISLEFDQVLSSRFPSAQTQIQNHVVLVTGAGGTIGAELCRQLSRLRPHQLILLGRGENSIFHIDQELRATFPDLTFIPIIADIRNSHRIRQIFDHYSPDVVFHAAAHKHVPLMEQNPTEAIENNTIASANLAILADQAGISTFVLISTDKAVAPSNFMGLSKRLAELLVSAVAGESKTRFLSVRFGNVLGSRGSVVPIFRRQIAQGGPVTVTDPAMTRYFMTTPEAARLVVQSLAVGESGQTLILDMGQPVRIHDLAEQLIRLEGYTPGQEIKIQITGIRPGEKISESLINTSETMRKTPHPRIYSLVRHQTPCIHFQQFIDSLNSALTLEDRRELWEFLLRHLREIEDGSSPSKVMSENFVM